MSDVVVVIGPGSIGQLSRFQHVNPGSRTLASMSEEESEQVLNDLARALRMEARGRS